MKYAGLTDEPARRKQEHGNAHDFRVMQQFTSEPAAKQWKSRMLAQGYEEDTSGKLKFQSLPKCVKIPSQIFWYPFEDSKP